MTAALVPAGSVLADIGTDHAHLPVHLVRQGICPRAIASDIGEGPLQNAAQTVSRAGLEAQIELRLSNGFACFAPADATCWVLAGMGGTLMARLLTQAAWLCAPGTVLVLQPMRHAWEVRAWLCSHGFCIEMESACYDAGRVYGALRAAFCPARANAPHAAYVYTGELPRCKSPAASALLAREYALLQTRAAALLQANCQSKELERLRKMISEWGQAH
jgi:tRNA (adenine22-N1)-methyltransferase